MTLERKKTRDKTKEISAIRRALPQVIAVGVKNVLLLGFGMTLGFPTILIPSLSGGDPEESMVLGQEEISWIGSINYLWVPLGCFLSGVITQPLGRRRAMQLVNLPFLAAWLLFYFSNKSWHVFLALSITGFSGGLLEAPVLTYVAEITEPHIRGTLSATSTMAISLGILISFLLGTFLTWRTMALVNSAIPFIALTLLTFVPETPYWLISKKRLDEAKKSLAWLRGWTKVSNIEDEYLRIYNALQKNPKEDKSKGGFLDIETLKLYLKPSFLKPYLLITLVFAIGHFQNTPISIYAINIFTLMQVPISSYYATVVLGIVQLLGILICVSSIKCMGKRRLTWISLLGVTICFMVAGIYSYQVGVKSIATTQINGEKNVYNWIPLVTLVGQAFFNYLGIKGLPWIIIGEIFPNDVRAFASGFSAATGYILGFIANKTFLSTMDALTFPGLLWLDSCIAFIGLILLYFLFPETEGKTLEQITNHFAGGKKLNNNVYREEKGEKNKGFVNDQNAIETIM